MNTIAEFTIIGRVGEIKQVGTTLRVNIASSYSRKDNRGEWVERTRWNEVTVFGESTRGYVNRNIVKGDLVFTSGSMGQTKWEKDGETFYGVTLAGRTHRAPVQGPEPRRRQRRRAAGEAAGARRRFGRHPVLTAHPRTGEASASPPFSRRHRRGRQSMAYQIYRIGEWERVGGVDGYSTICAYLQPGLYETEAFARKKAARLADQDYENGGDGSFRGRCGRRKPVRRAPPVAQRLVGGPSARLRFRRLPTLRAPDTVSQS